MIKYSQYDGKVIKAMFQTTNQMGYCLYTVGYGMTYLNVDWIIMEWMRIPNRSPGGFEMGGMHPRWKPAGNWSDAASEFRYQTPFAGRKKASSSDSAKM